MTEQATSDSMDWTSLVAEHEPRLRRVVARRVPTDLIDDVVQETLLRAYRSRHALDLDRPIGPWLATIAIRVATDLSRHARSDVGLAGVTALSAAGPDAELATIERMALIRRALAALSPRHRHLLESVALDGVSQVALAQREGVAPEVIRSTVLRARQRFRVVYERLAQEHGLVGLGGSIKSALTTLRVRSVHLEPSLPRKVEAAAVLVGILTLGSSAIGEAPAPPEWTAPDAAASERHGQTDDQEHRSGSADHRRVELEISTNVPSGETRAGVSHGGSLSTNGYWNLDLHPVGLAVIVGTTESSGRLSVELTTVGFGLGTTAYARAEGHCDPAPNRKTFCLTLDLAEVLVRTAEEQP